MSHINIWQMSAETLRLVKVIEPYGEFPVTTLTIWNKIARGLVIAGYGSGHLRLFSIPGMDFLDIKKEHLSEFPKLCSCSWRVALTPTKWNRVGSALF